MIISNIFNQLKHIPLKALVAQWVHPLTVADMDIVIVQSNILTNYVHKNTTQESSLYSIMCKGVRDLPIVFCKNTLFHPVTKRKGTFSVVCSHSFHYNAKYPKILQV